MKNNPQGFSLTELAVGLAIGAILILTVGVISSINNGSYDKIRNEAEVYNQIFYGFNFIKYTGRKASAVNVDTLNNTLTFGDMTFKKSNGDFVYTDSGGDHTILSGVENLVFGFYCSKDADGNWLPDSCSAASSLFHVTLSGIKNKVAFNLSTDVARRN